MKTLAILLTLVMICSVAEAGLGNLFNKIHDCMDHDYTVDTDTHAERAGRLAIPVEGEIPLLPRDKRTFINPKAIGGYTFRHQDSHWFVGTRITLDLWPEEV